MDHTQTVQIAGGRKTVSSISSDLQHPPQRIVIGLGNPILGDDGFGWIVAEQVRQRLIETGQAVDIDCFALGGLSLMEHLVGYDDAILVDAIHLGQAPVGTVVCLPLQDIPDVMAGHLASSHDTTLKTAIQVGRSLGANLPERITVVGVETTNTFDFSEELSAPVAAAVPRAVQVVLDLLVIQGC